MSIDIQSKVALVTGGGRGIGKGIALVFGHSGAKVLVSNRTEAAARLVAEEINDHGGEASFIEADVTRDVSIRAAVAAAMERYGQLDILAHNAGIFPIATIETMTEAMWNEVIDTNLRGTFFATKAAFEVMKPRHYGRIVVTSSITGPRTGIAGLSHYAASKGGVNGFIKVAAMEFAIHGITVNGVEPGTILTDGLLTLGADYLADMARTIPLQRPGHIDDIGNAALFLASEAAGYITGQTIVVDGGQILPESPMALAVPTA